MDGKVMIAQTLVRRTQQDFNLMAMADGVNAFPGTVFSDGTCSTRGAIPKVITNLTLWNATLIMTDFCKSGCRLFLTARSDVIRLDAAIVNAV